MHLHGAIVRTLEAPTGQSYDQFCVFLFNFDANNPGEESRAQLSMPTMERVDGHRCLSGQYSGGTLLYFPLECSVCQRRSEDKDGRRKLSTLSDRFPRQLQKQPSMSFPNETEGIILFYSIFYSIE
jgi:hypothetical protein